MCFAIGVEPTNETAATVDAIALDAARREGRHAVHVRREDDLGGAGRRQQVHTTLGDRLARDDVPAALELLPHHRADRGLLARGALDVDQAARERNDV